MNRAIQNLRQRIRRDESGFTVVEVTAAVLILAISIVALAYTATIGFSHAAAARRQQTATQLANREMEEISALDKATIQQGLNPSDTTLSSDTNIVSSACVSTSTVTLPCAGETLLKTSTAAVGTPLNPHVTTNEEVSGTPFTIKRYVTWADNDVNGDLLRITTAVIYDNPPEEAVVQTSSRLVELVSTVGSPGTELEFAL